MRAKPFLLLLIVASLLALTAACAPPIPTQPQESGPNLANPASAYCEEQGHKLEIRKDENGNEQGFCVFEDGSECEEWAFFRGECGMEQQNALSLNLYEAAGLDKAEKVILLGVNTASVDPDVSREPRLPGAKVLLEITDAAEIQTLLKPLDKTLPLVTPMRCPCSYFLEIQMQDGTMRKISIGLCGLRGDEPYWHDKALRPPEDFTTHFNQLLEKAGISTP